MKILIVKLGAVGDVVHTLPALHSLRKSFPDAFIAWAVERKSMDVIAGNPDLDEVIIFERKELQKVFKTDGLLAAYRYFADFVAKLKEYDFDLAIDFQTLFKSGIITLSSGAKKRLGFDKWRELNRFFTNHRVKAVSRHTVDKYLELVDAAGGRGDGSPVKIVYSAEDASHIDSFLREKELANRPWVAINPGASWTSKLWPVEKFAALCDILGDSGIPVVVIWGPGEEPLVKGIVETARLKPYVAPPTTLKQLACLLERSVLYVGGDTGPMHMAVAMGTPVVGIFGPSDPERNGPYGEGHRVLQTDIDCVSCWKKRCSSMKCMDNILAEKVADAVKEILG